MSERVVAKSGGTSNADIAPVQASLEWAAQSSIFIPSAPGKLHGEDNLFGKKVTDLLLTAHNEYIEDGEISPEVDDAIVMRYERIVDGLGSRAMPTRWIDHLSPRIEQAVRHGEDAASMIGERFMAEIYAQQGFVLIDPGRTPHDLGTDPEAWRGWLSSAYDPDYRHVLIGNTTRVNGQLRTFSRGGSDTSGGFAAYGIQADLNLNLTDGGAKSADPKLVGDDNAIHIPHLLYVEGRELGRNGTGLVHPAAMVPLMRGNIPTEIRSTTDRSAPFTELDNDIGRAQKRAGRPLALSLMEDVVVQRIYEPGMAEDVGRLETFETAIAEAGIPLVDSQGDGVDAQEYFVDQQYADKSASILAGLTRGGSVESSDPLSFVTLVGYRLKRRLFDNLIGLHFNAGLDGKMWQFGEYPFSLGRHSMRLGAPPEQGAQLLKRVHEATLERFGDQPIGND